MTFQVNFQWLLDTTINVRDYSFTWESEGENPWWMWQTLSNREENCSWDFRFLPQFPRTAFCNIIGYSHENIHLIFINGWDQQPSITFLSTYIQNYVNPSGDDWHGGIAGFLDSSLITNCSLRVSEAFPKAGLLQMCFIKPGNLESLWSTHLLPV